MDSRTNVCNVNFVGTLVLLRIPQRVKTANCCGFGKLKRISQFYADTAYNLLILLTICGILSQFIDSTYNLRFTDCNYSCRFHDSLNLLNTSIILFFGFNGRFWNLLSLLQFPLCLRILQSCLFLE